LSRAEGLGRAIVAAALLWHALAVVIHGWLPLLGEGHGRDFASYYYAVQVAADGGDPYEQMALSAAAQRDGTRKQVFPFFYPPPFLLFVAWARPLDLVGAWRLWFWLDELAIALAAVALIRWWRPLGEAVPVALAATVAAMTAVYDNHLMGQANLPVLAVALLGLWQAEKRPALGGALMGVACMAKMSPGLFVAWWLVQRRWTEAAAACVAAVVLTLVSFVLVPPDVQWRFYTEILPGFGSGDYNGLNVPITMFGNHSVPNVWQQLFRGTDRLSPAAQALSSASLLALCGGVLYAFRRPPADALAGAGQAAAIAVVMLLVPVYTYEHHVVWAIPAIVVTIVALWSGRLDPRAAVPVGLAFAATAWDLSDLKELWTSSRAWPTMALLVQEAKFLALVVWLVAAVVVGRSRPSGGEG
jgi:alpha-1,2-mannosyltransferase